MAIRISSSTYVLAIDLLCGGCLVLFLSVNLHVCALIYLYRILSDMHILVCIVHSVSSALWGDQIH